MSPTSPEQFCSDGRTLYTGTNADDRIKKSVFNSDGTTDPRYLIFGLEGDDSIDGANNDDQVVGGIGADRIDTKQGNDEIWGMADPDVISAREGDDYADGGAGNDRIYSHEGNDTLVGGLGQNTMMGGTGIDLFVSQYVRGSGDEDRIYGMDQVGEKLVIEGISNLSHKVEFNENLVLVDQFGQDIATIIDLAQTQRRDQPEWGSRVRIQGNLVEVIERVDRYGIFVETAEGTPTLPDTTRPAPEPCTTVDTPQAPSSNPSGLTGEQPEPTTPDNGHGGGGNQTPENPNNPGHSNQNSQSGNQGNGHNNQPPINININIDNTDNNNNSNTNNNDFSTKIVNIQEINLNLDDMLSSDTRRPERINGTRDDDIIGSGLGRNVLRGMGGSDDFVFNVADKFKKRHADQIVDFKPGQGDQLVVSDDALPGLKDPTFATASSKRDLRALAREVVDLIYFEKKGQLFYNANDDGRGMGNGGLFAILKNKPDLSQDDLAFLAG
jgi:hypothetical protein